MDTLSREEALEVLATLPVAHLGMVEEGHPYVTPMSFVLDEERILFRTVAGRKLDCLRANPSVCVEASRYDEESGDWVSVIIDGTAVEVDDDSVKQKLVSLLFRKYEHVMGSPLSTGDGLQAIAGQPHVIEVTINDLSGMVSGRGWARRTRPGRL